jgi:putative oxidoreductase
MIADMFGALAITKVLLLWGDAALYPKEGGFWDFFHEGRLEVAMLCGCLCLLIVGPGPLSVGAWMNRADADHRVQTASVFQVRESNGVIEVFAPTKPA